MSHEAPVASHLLSEYGIAFRTGLHQSGYLALQSLSDRPVYELSQLLHQLLAVPNHDIVQYRRYKQVGVLNAPFQDGEFPAYLDVRGCGLGLQSL
jgi:hypothetical protein